jgi:Protein of unknown function (DUF2934)
MDEPNINESNPIVDDHTTTGGHSDDAHERIAKAAYFIWVSQGYPEGKDEAHWHEAQQQLLREEAGPKNAAGNQS